MSEPRREPTPDEIWGPGGLTDEIRATWADMERDERQVTDPLAALYEPSTVPPGMPTPAEIRAACEEIQREWTDMERDHRRGRRHGNCKDGGDGGVEIREATFGDGITEPNGDD